MTVERELRVGDLLVMKYAIGEILFLTCGLESVCVRAHLSLERQKKAEES